MHLCRSVGTVSDEKRQTRTHPGPTCNLPDQGAGRARRELVRLGHRDDDSGRDGGRGSTGHHLDRHCGPGHFARRAAPALLPGIAIDFGKLHRGIVPPRAKLD